MPDVSSITKSLPAFKAAFPWYGGDLQTIRSTLVKKPSLPRLDERLSIDLLDGSGALSVAVTNANTAAKKRGDLVLFHGLGGHEESVYMMRTANQLSAQGFRVFRMNYRGVGHSRKTSKPPYSAGLTDDVRAVMRHVMAFAGGTPPYAMGFSLGGQMLLRALGEDGEAAQKWCGGVMTVSAPLNLEDTVQVMEGPRNKFYQKYLVGRLHNDLRPFEGGKVEAHKTIRAIDHHVVAPVFGYSSAEAYYKGIAAFHVLADIKVPTLMMHAMDDPWIPNIPYRADRVRQNKSLATCLTKSGGHVGFYDKSSRDGYISKIYIDFYRNLVGEDL